MRNRLILIAYAILELSVLGKGEVWGQAHEIFHIGKQDHSFAEFARERRPGSAVVYRVGLSSPAHDWYSYQPGTFDYEVGRSTRAQDWTTIIPARKEIWPRTVCRCRSP